MIGYDALADFDVASLLQDAAGQPLSLPVDRIEPDPHNVRRSYGMQALAELADSIAEHGLIQAITVRHHPDKPDHYQIVTGERRWRAHVLLQRTTIAAVIRDDLGVYAQATENLQREELAALDILQFVRERRAVGDTLTDIAKQLGKSKAFIAKAAQVADAPAEIVTALEQGRVGDLSTAYLLARAARADGARVRALLENPGMISRERAEALCAALEPAEDDAPAEANPGGAAPQGSAQAATTFDPAAPTDRAAATRAGGAGRRVRTSGRQAAASDWLFGRPNVLGVDIGGRAGALLPSPGEAGQDFAEIAFDDGSRERVALADIRLTQWRTRP